MTEQEFGRTLRRALLDAVAQDEKAAPKPDSLPPVSAQHARSMQKMLRDPLRWARARRRPTWQRPLQAAAMVAIVGSLTLGALRIAPDVSAFIRRYFVTDREQDVLYEFVGELPDGSRPEYILSSLPAGYTLDESASHVWASLTVLVYRDSNGNPLYFEYNDMNSGVGRTLSKEGMDVSDVTVNGYPGVLFLAQNPERDTSGITWVDEETNTAYLINGYFTSDELLALAESVIQQKKS